MIAPPPVMTPVVTTGSVTQTVGKGTAAMGACSEG